jgi:dephospho-CoA kinase
VIINNYGSFEDTWGQVLVAWKAIFPAFDTEKSLAASTVKGGYTVERARPRQAKEIAAYITRVSEGQRQIRREDVMEAFGEKAFMLLRREQRLVGLLGWQVENLVARTDDLYLESDLPTKDTLHALLDEVETASKELQCEIILLFVTPDMVRDREVWKPLGYQLRTISSLGVRAWQEAATESMPANSAMLFKQLRKDRVLRPV